MTSVELHNPGAEELPQPTNSVAVFVLGLLSLVMLGLGFILGPIALVLSSRGRAEVRQGIARSDSLLNAGFVMAIIGTILGFLTVVIVVCAFVFAFALGSAALTNSVSNATTSEAVRNIGTIKQRIEMWHMENPAAAMPADLSAWELAGGQMKAQFTSFHYDDYEFLPGAVFDPATGRYVGEIKAVGTEGVKNVRVKYGPDGIADPPVIE